MVSNFGCLPKSVRGNKTCPCIYGYVTRAHMVYRVKNFDEVIMNINKNDLNTERMVSITNLDRKRCYLDISIDSKAIGRIVIELYNDLAPLAAENFFQLCSAKDEKNKQGIPLTLKGNYFHRVIRNFIVQAGDIVHCSNVANYPPSEEELSIIGTGGASVYLDNASEITDLVKLYNKFNDENLNNSKFDTTFNVAMSNNDANSNTSQFFINTYPSPHLDGKHTVFGKVVHGKAVVRTIEQTNIINKDSFLPKEAVKIVDCGEFTDNMDVPCAVACYNTIGGDTYEEYPDDDDSFDKDDYHMSYKVCSTIKGSGNLLYKQKNYKDAILKFQKASRYVDELKPEKDVLITATNTEEQNLKNYALLIDYLHLKKSLYSNLALTCLKLQNYNQSIKYSNYMIDMLEVYPKYEKKFKADNAEFLKCYYRIGKCFMLMNRLDKAKEFLTKANNINTSNDQLVIKDLETVEKMIAQKKENQKKSLSKFFS